MPVPPGLKFEMRMRKGCNQYAPMQGVALLRERIAATVLELYSAGYDPASEISELIAIKGVRCRVSEDRCQKPDDR